MYQYKVLEGGSQEYPDLIASMHKLRYDIFHKELGWSVGLNIRENHESDEYDRPGTFYIVRVNTHGDVDAVSRFMPTNAPYMLQEYYPHFISKEPIPISTDVWEISRSAASIQARKESNGKVLSELLTATVEFGLAHDVQRFISLTTVEKRKDREEKKPNIYRILTTSIGWDSTPMGELLDTPDDRSYALKHSVSFEMLEHFRSKHGFRPLLYDFEKDDVGNIINVKELWHDNNFIRKDKTEIFGRTTGISPGINLGPLVS